jgi:hypothetical protein
MGGTYDNYILFETQDFRDGIDEICKTVDVEKRHLRKALSAVFISLAHNPYIREIIPMTRKLRAIKTNTYFDEVIVPGLLVWYVIEEEEKSVKLLKIERRKTFTSGE